MNSEPARPSEKVYCMRGSRKSCQTMITLFSFFSADLVDEGREDPNTTVGGPSSARKRNAIKMMAQH